MDKEIFKQWFGQIVRCAVSFIFGVIVSRKWFPEEYAGILLDSTIALITALLLLQLIGLFWGFAKV